MREIFEKPARIFKYGPALAALLVLPWLAGCVGPPSGAIVDLGEQFSLSPGQSASIAGEDMTIRFIEVIGDSRCPEGALCIWAGEVSCQMEITYREAVSIKVLVQSGHSTTAEADFADYKMSFDVQPYPQVGQKIDKGDYKLVLTVSKKAG